MDIKNRIAEIIGEASMCWSETPTGVFDSVRASQLTDELFSLINSNETVIMEKTNEELAETYGDPNSMASTDESDELKEDLKSLAETTESDILE